jgi:hypothetical protein
MSSQFRDTGITCKVWFENPEFEFASNWRLVYDNVSDVYRWFTSSNINLSTDEGYASPHAAIEAVKESWPNGHKIMSTEQPSPTKLEAVTAALEKARRASQAYMEAMTELQTLLGADMGLADESELGFSAQALIEKYSSEDY